MKELIADTCLITKEDINEIISFLRAAKNICKEAEPNIHENLGLYCKICKYINQAIYKLEDSFK